ncbi:MAG: DUF3617 domain-containing protein [Rhodoferax sp.]
MKLHRCWGAMLLSVAATGLSAQTLKSGLWEVTSQIQGGSGETARALAEAQKQLANLPPDQARIMRDMMARQGVQMASAPGGGTAIKTCMTPDMVARDAVAPQQGDCTHTSNPRVGNRMPFSFVCTQPPSRGEGQVTFVSPEAYTVQITATTAVNGKPEKIDLQASGRWLGAACGTVQPLPPPQ